MTSDNESNKDWDVFVGNHFLGRVTASNEAEALETGLRLYGSHLDGILKVRPRAQTAEDGSSRPI